MVHFDERDKAQYGKWRPLEDDGSPHHCPGPTNQEVSIPSTSQYIPQQQQQQQQVGIPRPLVVQVEKGTWDRLREQIISIHRMMSQMAIDIDEIKRDIAAMKSESEPQQQEIPGDIFGKADDTEF